MNRRDEIRARLSAATPGEWSAERRGEARGVVVAKLGATDPHGHPSWIVTVPGLPSRFPRPEYDAALIAAAPADLAFLLSEVERLSRVESAALRLVGPEPRFSESSAVRELRAALEGAEGCAECERRERANDALASENERQRALVEHYAARAQERADAATAAERERCARVCEERGRAWLDDTHGAVPEEECRRAHSAANGCAAAIRRGGE